MNTTDFRWHSALAALVQYARDNRHAVATITRMMNERTGQNFLRQQVITYVHHDPNRRREPRLGVGLLLIEISRELVKGKRK